MGYLRLVRSLPTPPQAAEDACVQAFDRELDYVFAILRRLGVPAAEVEDLAHDVFVVLHRNWPTLDTERPLRPYLFGVAFRIVSARRRKRARESPQEAPEMKDDAPSPEESLESRELTALLLSGLEQVPLSRRAVLILHDLDGVPIADIAETLSISRFGTYARLHKARRELASAVRQLQTKIGPK